MGTVVEAYHDEKGIIWPQAIAPFTYVVIGIGDAGTQQAEKVYDHLLQQGAEVVLDDRNASPGFKMKDADLIGYPYKIVVSDKTLAHGDSMVELIERATGDTQLVDLMTKDRV